MRRVTRQALTTPSNGADGRAGEPGTVALADARHA